MQEIKDKEIDLSKLSALNKFSSFFQSGEIENIAKQTGFVVRSSSRLSGEAFLKMIVEPICPGTEWSLNDQCDYLSEHFGINMTTQSLDERYHTFSVSFLKECYDSILKESVSNEVSGLTSSLSPENALPAYYKLSLTAMVWTQTDFKHRICVPTAAWRSFADTQTIAEMAFNDKIF